MTSRDTLDRILTRATRAPSSHNTQPWLFRLRDQGIDLLADRTRALPVNDPEDRELTISCGCALMTLRIAAAAEGLGTKVTLLPDAQDEDLLAHMALTGAPDKDLAALAPVIDLRQTHRVRFKPQEIAEEDLAALIAAATAEGTHLVALPGTDLRARIAELVAEGDAAQWADPRWRRELAQWMHPRRTGDGLTLPWLAVPVAQMVVRRFDMGGGVAANDSDLAEGSPLLALLATDGDDPADWLNAGQALQRVLLTGVQAGLQASYLNQPIEVGALRDRLRELAGDPGQPQILLRMGYTHDQLKPTPRRPLTDCLVDDTAP